jgi:hypothetical protein
VVGKWCGELDEEQMRYHLDQETQLEADAPEAVLDQREEHMAAAETQPLQQAQAQRQYDEELDPTMPVAAR